MKVHVSLYASLASRLPPGCKGNACTLDLDDGTAISGLLDQLQIAIEEPKIIFLNGIHARLGDVLKDSDRIAIFPPIAGG